MRKRARTDLCGGRPAEGRPYRASYRPEPAGMVDNRVLGVIAVLKSANFYSVLSSDPEPRKVAFIQWA